MVTQMSYIPITQRKARPSNCRLIMTQKKTDTPDKFTKDLNAAKVKVLETTTYDGIKCKVMLIQDSESKA